MTEKKKTKSNGWPKSRLAHSNEGRVGQTWRPELDSDAFNVAHLSTSGEFATIRGVRLADKPLDAAGPGFLWELPEVQLRGIRAAINILVTKEQELQEEKKRLSPKKGVV